MSKSSQIEYPDYFARFYDLIYSHIRKGVDTAYFLDKIVAVEGPVLEIGVGTGRFFIEALLAGADIYGVDISPAMIDVLKKKLPPGQHSRVSVADAKEMKLDRKFALIVAPFRMMSHIIDTKDQLCFLNNVHAHLLDGGIFIFDLFVPDPRLLADGINGQVDFDGEHMPGKRLQRVVSSYPDIVNQLLDVTMKFIWEEEDKQMEKTWNFKMRFYFRYELEYLVNKSLLDLVTIFGDYKEHPLTPQSRDFIVVCKRNG